MIQFLILTQCSKSEYLNIVTRLVNLPNNIQYPYHFDFKGELGWKNIFEYFFYIFLHYIKNTSLRTTGLGNIWLSLLYNLLR